MKVEELGMSIGIGRTNLLGHFLNSGTALMYLVSLEYSNMTKTSGAWHTYKTMIFDGDSTMVQL